ncbi:MAG: outer membrane beta-barrel protein [Desulfobacteraceae bacterium]|nr:outer membrane beta-barrel protein [Desulfobacteraceae bacterium]
MNKKVTIIYLILLCLSIISFQSALAEEIPTGQSPEKGKNDKNQGITADVFGDEGGYFHPFLTIETIWSSNLFYSNTDEDSSYTTTIEPGLWVALPESREKLMNLTTAYNTPGGVEFSHMQADSSRKMQTYFLYSPSFVYYSDQAKFNHTNHKVEGLFIYNFGFNLSLEILDQYNVKSEINDDGLGKLLDEYQDNVFSIIAAFEPSPKFKIRVDYLHYSTRFEKDVNEFRDRKDNSMSAYVFYKFMPKTSAFIEYERTNIDYDHRSDDDSSENRYYGGIDWEISAKSKGRLKAGYLEKEFDDDDTRDDKDFSLEAQIQHTLTPKSSISFNGYQKYHETSMTDSYFVRTRGGSSAFLLRFSPKWSGAINASYSRETYEGSDQNGAFDERQDNVYGVGPAIKFDAKKWLVFEAGFHYTERNSNYDTFDYTNRMAFLRIKIAL